MIKKEIIIVPERPTEVNHIICDDCDSNAFTKCMECGADICVKCRKYHPEDSGGDYTGYICESCMEVLKSYLPKIEELEDRLDALKDERRISCIKKRKAKNNETNKTKLSDTN
jgi:hypothetical protein